MHPSLICLISFGVPLTEIYNNKEIIIITSIVGGLIFGLVNNKSNINELEKNLKELTERVKETDINLESIQMYIKNSNMIKKIPNFKNNFYRN